MADKKKLISVLEKFGLEVEPQRVEVLGKGHINDSYAVYVAGNNQPDYLLQRINDHVFKNIPGILANGKSIESHLKRKLSSPEFEGIPMEVAEIMPGSDGNHYVCEQGYWRLTRFIQGCTSYEKPENATMVYESGRMLGRFHRMLHDFPVSTLHISIPGFHDNSWRLNELEAILRKDPHSRYQYAAEETGQILERAEQMLGFNRLLLSGDIPRRVVHNDPKINNVLFNDESKAVSLIDWDTIMPGTVLYDFGDAIRTQASCTVEDDPDPRGNKLNPDYFHAFARGYIHAVQLAVTGPEWENLAFSPLFMTYNQALRFLSDYLSADTYYKTAYEHHNLVRARNQLHYLQSLEEALPFMEESIRSHIRS